MTITELEKNTGANVRLSWYEDTKVVSSGHSRSTTSPRTMATEYFFETDGTISENSHWDDEDQIMNPQLNIVNTHDTFKVTKWTWIVQFGAWGVNTICFNGIDFKEINTETIKAAYAAFMKNKPE